MALRSTPNYTSTFFPKLTLAKPLLKPSFLSFPTHFPAKPISLTRAVGATDEGGEKNDPQPGPIEITDELGQKTDPKAVGATDEGGEKNDPQPLLGSGEGGVGDLKRNFVDSVNGSGLGFRSGAETRAEALELVSKLEALNPTKNPLESCDLLDGNWVLVYTAFSELLPLLAAGEIPLLKVEKISQSIDSSNLTIVNSTTLSNPFAAFSFSATAVFEARSPSRIQVHFKEGAFYPPAIKSNIELPKDVDVFGRKVDLSPVNQTLNPLQEVATNVSRTISELPPLKVPIPGDVTKSWFLISYLDNDFRILRGDGGVFVLVKEDSSLLENFV